MKWREPGRRTKCTDSLMFHFQTGSGFQSNGGRATERPRVGRSPKHSAKTYQHVTIYQTCSTKYNTGLLVKFIEKNFECRNVYCQDGVCECVTTRCIGECGMTCVPTHLVPNRAAFNYAPAFNQRYFGGMNCVTRILM